MCGVVFKFFTSKHQKLQLSILLNLLFQFVTLNILCAMNFYLTGDTRRAAAAASQRQ